VLSRKIAGLTGLRRRRLARVELASLGRVEVGHGGGAVSVRADRHLMDMVNCSAHVRRVNE